MATTNNVKRLFLTAWFSHSFWTLSDGTSHGWGVPVSAWNVSYAGVKANTRPTMDAEFEVVSDSAATQ